jgi:iron complex outermembrane receptor protein
VIAVVACVLAATPAVAQPPTGPDTVPAVVPLDSLQVTVTRRTVPVDRVPAAVSAVDRSTIQDGQPTVTLDEALAAVPGVFVSNRYNFSLGPKISVRGLGARTAFGVRGVRVLADGIPLTMPDGQTNLNNLDLGSAGRIEVIRGPASALYGNAAGGVIAITTEQPPEVPFAAEAKLVAGDLGRGVDVPARLTKLQAKAGGASGAAQYLFSVSRLETDGYRDFSAARQTLINTKARFALDPQTSLTAVLNAMDAPVAESPGSLPADSARIRPSMAWPSNVLTGSGEAASQVQAGIAFTRSTRDWRLEAALHGLTRSLDNALPFGYILLDRRSTGGRLAYVRTFDIASRPVALTIGGDIEAQWDDRREFDNDDGQRGEMLRRDQTDMVAAVAPFAQATVLVSDAIELTGGARLDRVRFSIDDVFLTDGRDDSGSRTLSALSSFAGIVWAPSAPISVFANVSTTFQTPTTTELINAPPRAGEPCCPSGLNPELEPQTATGLETGIRAHLGSRASLELALFRLDVRNTLVPFQVAEVEAREFFRNAGASLHRGIEAGARVAAGPVSGSLAYTYSDFFFTDDGLADVDFDGHQLPGVPPHHLFAAVRFSPAQWVAVEAEADHTSRYYASDANDANARNPAATVFDLRIIARARAGGIAVEPFIAINNITDERYNASVVVNAATQRYFEPAPGRHLYLGATIASPGWRR